MWSTDTIWFDLAIVMSIFAVGNILFGHFEEHKPKPKRLLKVALVAGITLALSYAGLRWVAFTLIGIFGLLAAYAHLWWLPSHGINGWTGEPKEKYYELLRVRPRDRSGTP
jgi:dolichyl-phosphate-mannose--protein O-mannosyl transferase